MFCLHMQGLLILSMKESSSMTEYEVRKSVRMPFKSCISNSHPLTSGDTDYLHVKISAIASCLEQLG